MEAYAAPYPVIWGVPRDTEQSALNSVTNHDAPVWTPAVHRRFILAAIAVLSVVLLVVVPPYISISRYQRRVAAAISGALGRAVHFDQISLQLLPVPGLVIQNFTVNDDPAFGAEPILRANTVTARLRLISLWRRRVEVSRISLEAPSINLVHRPTDSRWNLQGILQEASQIDSAPTAQTRAGDAPRFPYIEATGARINFKNGVEKLPFSLKETDFALWLPQPDQWRLRLSGRPVRTDTDVSDIGLVKMEATLGRAVYLQNAPIDVSASWKRTPMGEASKLTAGYDLGWRGDASLDATLHGIVGRAKLVADLHLLALRRAEYFPEHPMEVQAHCESIVSGILGTANNFRCAIPTDNSTSFLSVIEALRPAPAETADEQSGTARPGVLLLQGEVRNLLEWRTISGTASLTGASPDYALGWMRLFSRRIPQGLNIGGTINLTASTAADSDAITQWDGTFTCDCILPRATATTNPDPQEQNGGGPARSSSPERDSLAPANPHTAPAAENHWLVTLRHDGTVRSDAADVLTVAATQVNGENKDGPPHPASPRVTGQITSQGYTLTYESSNVVNSLADILPPLADNLPAVATGRLEVQHVWNTAQTWTTATPASRTAPRRHVRSRK